MKTTNRREYGHTNGFYPKPELIIYGNTPIADELVKFGKKYNFNVINIVSEAERIKNSNSNSEKFIVLATQGDGDLRAINDCYINYNRIKIV